MNSLAPPRPLLLVILDGWGISFVEKGNAIWKATTPNMDSFLRLYPSAAIQAAGIEVGLPWGEVGNSETGHRNIGAGSVQYQMLPAIDTEIEHGEFFKNEALLQAIGHARTNKSSLHLIGLLSPGGVHSHMNHLFALLKLCKQERLKQPVYIHIITDGRDTPPQSALSYLQLLEEAIGKHGIGVIASITGRFHAMDRNKNWDRTEATFNMLTGGPRPGGASSAKQALEASYAQNVNDEMIVPTAITRGGGPIAEIKDNDAVIFFNYRPDRARQLTEAFVQPENVGFAAKRFTNLLFVTMSKYDTTIPAPAAYTETIAEYPLARVLSEANLKQLHIAETEKYAHVTYYVDVGHEVPFPGEDHIMIPSSGATNFSTEPHMQAEAITDKIISEIERGQYDIYVVNFANADMVGHTGNFEATVEACEFVDVCMGRLMRSAHAAGGALLITGDHGNAEEKIHQETNEVLTDHTNNPVPLHYVHPALARTTAKSDKEVIEILSYPIGVLADIAPTVLEILQLPKPSQMTGVSLLNSLR
ncbi:MAG: 2,3-bisphosphoglycerate-independent phosphoglycerate mutase [Candidatus Andersenbacteria bacterium]|nr:2,3-bisphosphoglycerate-independent phosphoglycerate mutase [Candidatus Andersenbacteria bacterium]